VSLSEYVRTELAAPDLLDIEVLHVLRRWEHRREITTTRARQALDDLQAQPIVHHPARLLIDTAWTMRRTLSAYDAQYVALAKALSGALLTTDRRMATAARQLRVAVAQSSSDVSSSSSNPRNRSASSTSVSSGSASA
jgi:predicted nucleic acid-binding protein